MNRYSDFGSTAAYREEPVAAVEPPKACPSCGGRELKTTSKAVDRNSYWRCLACGEIWNLARRETGFHYGRR